MRSLTLVIGSALLIVVSAGACGGSDTGKSGTDAGSPNVGGAPDGGARDDSGGKRDSAGGANSRDADAGAAGDSGGIGGAGGFTEPRPVGGDQEAGVLPTLPGKGDLAAWRSGANVGPLPALEGMDADGFLHTRLIAAFAADAKVGSVNDALAKEHLAIACARPGMWSLTLSAPYMDDEAAARAVAAKLMESGAFLFVEPAWGEVNGQGTPPDVPALKSGDVSAHLGPPGFLAAWNASKLAFDRHAPSLVFDPDSYLSTEPDPRIGNQRFGKAKYGYDGVDEHGGVIGNHGFWTSGIIAAKIDNDVFSGTSPSPQTLLDLVSVQIVGASWPDKIATIKDELPAEGNFVISLSQGYNDPTFARVPRLARIVFALDFRSTLAPHHEQALISASAGNDGLNPKDPGAPWNSPFTTQHQTHDLSSMLTGADRTAFTPNWNAAIADLPTLAAERAHTLIVGSSTFDGDQSEFSAEGEDIRMVGEPVIGICAAATTAASNGASDPNCEPGLLKFSASGTSAAAPQVAGLAAYLWNLVPSATPAQIHAIISDTATSQWANAYAAVLALENAFINAPVRAAILDAVGADGKFTEADLQAYLNAIDANQAAEPDPKKAKKDFSRFDLNGDGFTRSDTGVPLDLDVDPDRSFTTISYLTGEDTTLKTVRLDENGITDLDALCYYAWTSRYSGDAAARDTLLEGRCVSNIVTGPRPHFVGTVTVAVHRSYAFSSLKGLGGSGGIYPSTTEASTTYKVDCPGAGRPGNCQVVSGQGTVSESITTEKPAFSQAGIGTKCEYIRRFSRTEISSASGPVTDQFNQQKILFEYPASPAGSLSVTLNTFGVIATSTVHDVISVDNISTTDPDNCKPEGTDETNPGGTSSPGNVNRKFSNVGTAPANPSTSVNGSFTANGTIPNTVIADPGNTSTIDVSWSLTSVED